MEVIRVVELIKLEPHGWFQVVNNTDGTHDVKKNTLYSIDNAPIIDAVPLKDYDELRFKMIFKDSQIEQLQKELQSRASTIAHKQIKWERDVAIEQLNSIGKSLGQTMDDVLVAIDRRTPKKPFGLTHECPTCHKVEFGFNQVPFCDQCGQAIDWTGVVNDE